MEQLRPSQVDSAWLSLGRQLLRYYSPGLEATLEDEGPAPSPSTMVHHRRLLRHLHLHDDHALRLDLPHDHVRHLLHDDCVLHHDHVWEILRLLARPRRYFSLLLPGHRGRIHNLLHHLATDSHP